MREAESPQAERLRDRTGTWACGILSQDEGRGRGGLTGSVPDDTKSRCLVNGSLSAL